MSSHLRVSRRHFFGRVGLGLGGAALGAALLDRLGFAEALAAAAPRRFGERLRFGALDPLVDLMQEVPADELLPQLVAKLRAGTTTSELVGAAALANARALGGTNYNGYHALMAMAPSAEMAAQFPAPLSALPVLKVVHRNARFLKEAGRQHEDALEPLPPDAVAAADGAALVDSIHALKVPAAEASLAAALAKSRTAAFERVQQVVREDANVHRVVLSWRAVDLQRFTGEQHAFTLLRQSVRFCIDEDGRRAVDGRATPPIGGVVRELVERHHLAERPAGTRPVDDATLSKLADTIFSSDGRAAAEAVAAALADGLDPEAVGAALPLAATRLLLHDPGLLKDAPGKPHGSVHGASVGVHASDAANAWRHIARAAGRDGDAATRSASLLAGAFHTAGQSKSVGAQPFDHDAAPCELKEPAELLREIEGRAGERDQAGAVRAARRYGELGHPEADLFALLLGIAVRQDGALHNEKYFRTVQEEHAAARPAHRADLLAALTRVMASSSGFPAPGCEEAARLLQS
jgi:hypothetical protein